MDDIAERAQEAITGFYVLNIPIAIYSYTLQQKILIDMLRGKRPLSKDNSLWQWWIWAGANSSTTAYSLFVVRDDLFFIVLSAVNGVLSLISALLNTWVYRLVNQQHRP